MEANEVEDALVEDMARFYADPLGFVMYAFPWSTEKSIRLVKLVEPYASRYDCEYGPDEWACEYLEKLGEQIRDRGFNGVDPVEPIRMAMVSGHGTGKSTISAWLTLFIASTRPYSKGTITANTSKQLKTKTWAEVGKWYKKCITKHWFNFNDGQGNMNLTSLEDPESWRVDAQTCDKDNSEAFAGQHAANSTSWYLFDEGSAVPDTLWEVAEGGQTDGEPMWFVFGNGTRNTGRFRECFKKFRDLWVTFQIDSRSAFLTNKELFKQWIASYGADSDFVRVRIKGQFPRASSAQFIPGDVAEAAQNIPTPEVYPHQPVIMALDVARFGDDKSVICARRGRNARDIHWSEYRGWDTMQLAAKALEVYNEIQADVCFIDGGGVGGGVVDRCRQLGMNVIEVQFGAAATEKGKYFNMRAQMWGNMLDALKEGLAIPDDAELYDDLTGIEYGYARENQTQLEKKEDMKKRGLASPDKADALALTYAYPVGPRDSQDLFRAGGSTASGADHDPFG